LFFLLCLFDFIAIISSKSRNSLLRASPTMPQTNASNRNIGLYTGKITPTVP
jgi:hypothetical protein